MKSYDSIVRFKDDGSLLGEQVYVFNKLDGQNFRVKYNPKTKQFTQFGSRNCLVDITNEYFKDAITYFKNNIEKPLLEIILENSGKNQIFKGIEEITFFFEWYGEKTFAGFHTEGDELKLKLIDIFLKKKGYIEPKLFDKIFCQDNRIETPEIIYHGVLNDDFIQSIVNNDWTKEDAKYPTVKEGVVVKRTTLLKGQRLPMCKIKTVWWLTELHNKYSEEECKILE